MRPPDPLSPAGILGVSAPCPVGASLWSGVSPSSTETLALAGGQRVKVILLLLNTKGPHQRGCTRPWSVEAATFTSVSLRAVSTRLTHYSPDSRNPDH